MILSHFDFEESINLSTEIVNVLVVENNKKYYLYCKEIINQVSGKEGGFSIFDGDKPLSIQKTTKVVNNIFLIDYNDKKIQNALYASLIKTTNEYFTEEYMNLISHIFSFFEKLNAESEFPIEYDTEASLHPLLKSFGMRLEEERGSLLEELISTMQVYSRLMGIKNFIFINLKCFLNEIDLQLFYNEARLEEVSLLLLENSFSEKLVGEKVMLIDEDLCEILL